MRKKSFASNWVAFEFISGAKTPRRFTKNFANFDRFQVHKCVFTFFFFNSWEIDFYAKFNFQKESLKIANLDIF